MKTTNYSLFKLKHNNRKINEGAVKDIMKSIKEIGYVEGKPIIVDQDFFVIDGQHRLEACRRLGIPVYYSISNIDSDKAMILLNMNQDIWRLADYILSWAKSGKQVYKDLIDFENKYKLGTSNNLVIFRNTARSADDVRKGVEFTPNSKADDIALFLLECKPYLSFYKNKSFVQSIVVLFRHCNKKQIEKVKSKIYGIRQQANVVDYIRIYENILNKYKKGGDYIKLSQYE